MSTDVARLAAPKDMTPEQLALALTNTYVLEQWIRDVRAHALTAIRGGTHLPGFKLGYGVRHRVWAEDTEQKLVAAIKKLKIDTAEIYTKPELLSPAKMEALLKQHKLWPAKPRNADRPPTPIDPFVTLSMPEPKIVRDTGKAGSESAEEEFG